MNAAAPPSAVPTPPCPWVTAPLLGSLSEPFQAAWPQCRNVVTNPPCQVVPSAWETKVSAVGAIGGVRVSTGKNPAWFPGTSGTSNCFPVAPDCTSAIPSAQRTKALVFAECLLCFACPLHRVLAVGTVSQSACKAAFPLPSRSWSVLTALEKARDWTANTVCNFQLKFRHKCEHK